MEENKRDARSVVMEGMYRGVTGKLEEVRQSVSKEIRFTSAQQISVYESLANTLREGLDAILNEVKYLAQQNSAIYESENKELSGLRDAISEQVRGSTESEVQVFGDMLRETEEKLNARIDDLREELLEAMGIDPDAAKTSGEHGMPGDESFDYDVLAEKIATVLPVPEYDELIDHIAAAIPPVDGDAVAAAVVAALPERDEEALAQKVAQNVPSVDYDLISDRVASVMMNEFDVTVDEQGVEKIAEAVVNPLDYDALAARIAALLSGRTADAVSQEAPAAETEEVREAPAAETEEVREAPVEEDDCSEAAAAELDVQNEEETAEAEQEAAASDAEEKPEREEELFETDPEPLDFELSESMRETADAAEDPQVEAAAATELAVADAADVPVKQPEMTTRYKRSFRAKIIESADAVKESYFALKNALLSYAGMSSQISWSNDRFALAGETLARIGVRGKTLCLYLDLDPAAYPTSVYHQRAVGDTKQYEKTPMMVKVRSATALKRALQLVAVLMERAGTVPVEREPVDYAEDFAFRSQEELIQEGLIKTSIVEKSDLDF